MTIKRNIKHWWQRRTRGWSDDECWNLDWEFIKWINSRFKKYKEQASKIVSLEFHRFEYKGKRYTQLELIDKIIDLTDIENKKILMDNYFSASKENINEIFDIFKLIYWTMWW